MRDLAKHFATMSGEIGNRSERWQYIIYIYILVYFDHFKIRYIITLRDQRIIDGMRDLSYFTACQSFLPLALAFGLKLPIAVGRIINRIHLTLKYAPYCTHPILHLWSKLYSHLPKTKVLSRRSTIYPHAHCWDHVPGGVRRQHTLAHLCYHRCH